MQFTQEDIAAIIGTKELEIIALRRELAETKSKLAQKDAGNVELLRKDIDGAT